MNYKNCKKIKCMCVKFWESLGFIIILITNFDNENTIKNYCWVAMSMKIILLVLGIKISIF